MKGTTEACTQAVDKRINVVDDLIHNEMSAGRDQLQELERVVSAMRGGVAGPDNFNTGSPRGGGPQPPDGSRDLRDNFHTRPNLHAAEQERQAW